MKNSNRLVIDSHAHCGIQDSSFDQSFESYFSYIKHTDIKIVVAFPPVIEIYDRYDYNFKDTDKWRLKRKNANKYLLDIGNLDLKVIPYFFIWNDFAVDQLTFKQKGIKWHRHSMEPVYHYDTDKCKNAIKEIKKRNMPVVLEEELENTIKFINEYAQGVRVIIPHLGGLNGGYNAIAGSGLWEKPNVYADTALASSHEISNYIKNYGHDRIMFGSDFPFGDPEQELLKITNLDLEPDIEESVLAGNIQRLLSDSNLEK
ncbi:MAG: amidohydrolase family protein [Desulfobacteraceae bacterium]|nr:amidohydrolase family protein [Desulfobacteraceae bacterium]